MRDFSGQAPMEPGDSVIIQAGGEGPIEISDGALLFGADFSRDGRDLLLENQGAPDIRIVDYFRTGTPSDLQGPDGGILRGAVVERLAGPEAPGQYAQIGGGSGAAPIGQVEKIGGEASVQRTDGAVEQLTPDSKIFSGDVVQTGAGGNLSITFVDGTIFTLTPGSRMVIDELIYTPGSQNNSGAFNLVQGGFVFIAGQVASTGGMEVSTPAATMGIRGTTVLVDVQTENGVTTAEVTLTHDPDGGLGKFDIHDLAGNLVAHVTGTASKWVVSTAGGETREVARSYFDEQTDNVLIAEVTAAYQQAFLRFRQGGNFVELDSVHRGGNQSPGLQNPDGGDGVDLDNTDQETAPELAPPPGSENNDDPTFDEGRNNLIDEPVERNIIITGLEDSEDAPIAGNLPSAASDGTFVLADAPVNGTVTIAPNGSYVYVPNENFYGNDGFTYVVTSVNGTVSEGIVTVDILPVNDAPVIEDQAVTVLEDGAWAGQAVGSDVEDAVLSYRLLQGAQHGGVVVTEDGHWIYTPDPDYSGSDQFAIEVVDSMGATATQVVVVTVTAQNDAPQVTSSTADAAAALSEGDAAVGGKLTASDADAGAVLTWSGSAAGAYGSFTMNADGSWSYALGAAAEALKAGQVVTESFVATVTDDQGATAAETVIVTITGANDGPVVTSATADARGALNEGGAAIGGQLTASDNDAGAVLTWSGSAAGAYGSFTMNADGSWSYALGAAAEALKAGQVVTESFVATVTDDQGATATETVIVTITGGNDGPVVTSATADARGALNEGGAAIGGQLTASDSDAGAVLIWSGSAAGAYGSFTMNADGSWSYALGASAEALKAGQVVTESFMATVTDEQGATATETVIVTITGANDGPVVTSATADARGALNEGGAAIGGQLTASDNDAGAVLTWSGSAAGAYGSFTMNADGSWSYALSAAAETLKAGQVVTESFTATVTDDQGATATEVVKITVTGTNDGPVALNVSTQTDQDNSVSGTLTATDIDNGATLVFALGADGPDHGSVLIQSDGNWTYTPDAGFAGLDRFDYTVTDDFGAAVTRTVTVAVNSAPYSNAGQQIVTLNILPEPGGLPAGSIFANASDVNATAVNLVVTLDRSGSVGQTQWTAMINAVADALETLADRFDGALTDVDVQIITYASSARVEGTFDLSDPGLIQMVRAMPYSGGQTNWTAALELTEDFFDAQPVGEKNFLYFITDGSPSSNTWQAVLDRLTDEATKGYSVDIEAFGVGSNVNYNTLALFDDTPTLLQGAEDLTDAFSQTPLFSAELVDLSVTLIADGVDQGQIADETAAGLVLSGFNATLSLADIDGLVTLLGEENRFSVTGGFDLDGDPTTVELTLFDSEVLGKAATAQDITGNEGSDLLFGSDEADSLSGGAGNDVMLGYGGDDTFVTGAGADTVLGGAGDDLIVVDSFDGLTGGRQETLDGGDGRDVLRIDLGGDLTADYMSLVDLSGIEALDMANGQANTVELTIADLLGMSGDQDDALAGLLGEDIGQSLTIYGDASDSVTLVGEAGGQFQATGAQVVDAGGAVLDIYQYTQGGDVLHTLAVDADVAVSMQPAA